MAAIDPETDLRFEIFAIRLDLSIDINTLGTTSSKE
jgi:hypothetical protein